MVLIKKIKRKDLFNFIKSPLYTSLKEVPISRNRANSYINNPNGNANDIVLYMAFINTILVAYRTVLVDTITIDKQQHTFGWLSGNWVNPKHRRKGISTKLFNEVYTDWNGKLMYTNYAEASKAVYDKTTVFTNLQTLKGFRYYHRICLTDLLPKKHFIFKKTKGILQIIDNVSNGLLDLRFKEKNTSNTKFIFEKITQFKSEITTFLRPFKAKELFNRNVTIYQWLQKYPWIALDEKTKEESSMYHFSSYAEKYSNSFYKIVDKNTQNLVGVIHVTIRNNYLKISYLYIDNEDIDFVGKWILDLCRKERLNYITIYDNRLNNYLKKNNKLAIKRKAFEQQFFITKSFLKSFPEVKKLLIQPGDGDGAFT